MSNAILSTSHRSPTPRLYWFPILLQDPTNWWRVKLVCLVTTQHVLLLWQRHIAFKGVTGSIVYLCSVWVATCVCCVVHLKPSDESALFSNLIVKEPFDVDRNAFHVNHIFSVHFWNYILLKHLSDYYIYFFL